MNTEKLLNALKDETSPYLLQHARNPVNWYPWGEEAFEKSKRENKPVFLSIGYSTCHWCHVMERESFEDREVADYLNQNYISIKVDREERPDIDAVYMKVCQAMTGSGGWPLTIFLTPDRKPFFAGTYFPKNRRMGYPGLMDILKSISESWRTSPQQLLLSGNEVASSFAESDEVSSGRQPTALSLDKAKGYFERAFDYEYGGFGSAPKFPTPHNLMFLLRYYLIKKDKSALSMAEKTLVQMYRGGIFDHVGFGFSRYSTDSKWLVPHFEKMLYDNALLTTAYLEAYAVTGNTLYKTVAEKILTYVQREMTSPEGGFYCAQDADSEGEEGKFYTFTQSEIKSVLGSTDGERFCGWFGVTGQGNFDGKNILNLIENPEYSKTDNELERMLSLLRSYREKRTALHKDDKILTSWNALMIAAYAKAYRILGEDRYLKTAEAALEFIRKNLSDEKGDLFLSYRENKAKGIGLLDDYAFLAWANLEMYEATYHVGYLDGCRSLMQKILARFWDQNGGCFLNASDGERLIFRPKEKYDGAMPSGNSVFAYCLAKLANLTGETDWRQKADMQLSFYYEDFEYLPYAHCFALLALMQSVCPTKEVVCVVGDSDAEEKTVHAIARGFYPQTCFLVKTKDNARLLEKIAPFTKNYESDNKTSAAYYVCQNKSCSPPVFSLDQMLRRLKVKLKAPFWGAFNFTLSC